MGGPIERKDETRTVSFTWRDQEFRVISYELPAEPPQAMLTPAEREVAVLMVQGHSPGEISQQRGTAIRTVRNQVARIYAKLGVASRAEFVAAYLAQR